MRVRPPPAFKQTLRVFVVFWDQVYATPNPNPNPNPTTALTLTLTRTWDQVYRVADCNAKDCNTNPPPELYISNPRAYAKLVKHAGGEILLKYIR